MGCGSSSDTVRQPPPQQQQQHRQQHQQQPQHQPAQQGPYPQAVLVHPGGNTQPPPVFNGYAAHQHQPPHHQYPPAQTAGGGGGGERQWYRGHGGVATDAQGWEQYDPSAFGGDQQPNPRGGANAHNAHASRAGLGYSSHNNNSVDDDEALAQAIARSLATAEAEERRARAEASSATEPPALPARQESVQVVFVSRPEDPFLASELELMPRIFWTSAPSDDEEACQCALCFEQYSDTPERAMMLLPCFHRFHWDCAADWLKRKPLCPVCKSNAKVTGSQLFQ